MTDTTKTPRFGLPYLDPSQSQPEVKINEAWDIIDLHLGDGSDVTSDSSGPGSITVEGRGSPGITVDNVTTLRFEGAVVESETGGVAVVVIPGGEGPTGPTGGTPPGAYWIAIGGGAVTLPVNAVERVMNASGTIKRIIIVTKGGPGNCTINIYKANITSHYPPVSGDDITGGDPPKITGASTYDDSTLSGYTTAFAVGDVFLFTISAITNFTSIGISLLI
jgi:hypothetical protein